jgi:hypothetical protein
MRSAAPASTGGFLNQIHVEYGLEVAILSDLLTKHVMLTSPSARSFTANTYTSATVPQLPSTKNFGRDAAAVTSYWLG